jgi:membrane-associated phospholipid phosphatase
VFFLQIDRAISFFLNRPAQHFAWLDQTAVVISNSDLIKGGVVLAIFWAMWFGHGSLERERLLAALGGSLVALAIARVLAYVTPLRLRPVLDPSMHFVAPIGLDDQSNWTTWSSFPSDHAALFFAVATGIWLVSRTVGILTVCYVVLVICLPRLYVGIHYPSDVLAGAFIGISSVRALNYSPLRTSWTQRVLRALQRWPSFGYGLLFLLTFQIATLFWDLRSMLAWLGFDT